MSSLLDATTFEVPRSAVDVAHDHLRQMGKQGVEGFALWVGVKSDKVVRVREAYIPRQRAVRSKAGLCVVVDHEELHRMNVWLYQNGLEIVAQLHSHPGSAYHSDTDDSFPVATTVGCLSVVVPNFAVEPFAVSSCAVYRLMPSGQWAEVPSYNAAGLISITE